MVKNQPASAGEVGDVGSVPGSGRSPGGGNGNSPHFNNIYKACQDRCIYQGQCYRGHSVFQCLQPMEISRMEEPGGLQSIGPQGVRHNRACMHAMLEIILYLSETQI